MESKITVFTRISAAALIKFFVPQVRRLIEGGAYLRATLIRGRRLLKNWTLQRNLCIYLPSVRKDYS